MTLTYSRILLRNGRTAILVLAAGIASAALAQPETAQAPAAQAPAPHAALYIPREQLKQIEDAVPANPATGRPGGFSKRLFTAANYSDSFIRITEPDKAHAHGKWSEVYVILEGAAVLETGGTIVDPVEGNSATHGALFLDAKPKPAAEPVPEAQSADPTAPKDLAGSGIAGGTRQAVKPGDVILIPAGVPHRWFSVDQPVVYHDVKFPR